MTTTNDDQQSDIDYKSDFDSTFTKSDGFGNYDASFASSKISDSKTFKMNKTNGEPLDEDELL